MSNDLSDVQRNALDLLTEFDQMFARSTKKLDLGAAKKRELAPALHDVAIRLESLFAEMVAERERVEKQHPWVFGTMLCWMADAMTDKDGNPFVDSDDTQLSRFRVMQRAGFWDECSMFNEWASQVTGMAEKTWLGWMSTVRHLLLSDEGAKVVKATGLSPEKFIAMVSMDKAERVAATVGRGEIQPHQVKALADPSVSSEGMRHALRSSAEAWGQLKEQKTEAERQFVEHGDGRNWWVIYDPADRTLRVKELDRETGEVATVLVAKFPVTNNAKALYLQDVLVEAAKTEAQIGDRVGDSVAEAVEKAEKGISK